MVIYCTNCGTKLDDDDCFCMNCGSKVDNSYDKSSNSLLQKIQDDKDKKKAKKELKRIVGRKILLSHSFINRLSENGLSVDAGMSIRKQMQKEIDDGQLKSYNVENRSNELLNEHKIKLEKEKKELQKLTEKRAEYIDELFESEDIKSKINEYAVTRSQIISIKQRLKNKKISKNEKLSKGVQKYNILQELENEMINNSTRYLKGILRKSCPNIKLASFEKKHVNSMNDQLPINKTKEKLDKTAENIINSHKKIGKYDFAGKLIEEGGFTNTVDIMDLKKRARKDSDLMSYVFIKIFEKNIKIVGSEIVPVYMQFSMTPKYKGVVGKDRTIFFNDITSIGYSNEEIHLNLINNEKLILQSEKTEREDENIEIFYKSLNRAWEEFKHNENNKTMIINEKNEITAADELMKYAELYEKGFLTEDEFNAAKKKLLGL